MIRTEIYIENQRLDLTQDISAELTISIDEIQDFGSRNTTFSKTVVLPGNQNNNQIFGNIFDFNRQNVYDPELPNYGYNYNPTKAADCVILVDKIQIFKGVIRLLEIIVDGESVEYECAVFGELGGFISALGNSRLQDLDFSTYDQIWNYTNITNSWNTISGSGVYFPLIDYGSVSVNKADFQFSAFRPAFYVKEILEKMIVASGYTWDFPLLNTDLFKRLIIPNNQVRLNNLSTRVFDADFTIVTTPNPVYIPVTVTTAGSFINSNPITYTAAAPLTVNITCRPIGQINGLTSFPANVTFYLKKNGTVLTQVTRYIPVANFYVNINLDASGIALAQNDIISVEVSSNITSYQSFGGQFEINSTVATDVPVAYNDSISMNNALPRGIYMKDFFASIVKMFNLYVYEDKNVGKKLVILPFIDFYSYTPGADSEWSNKIDRSKPMRIKPMSEISARYYQLGFKADNDYYSENYRKKFNEGYGDRYFDTQTEYAKETEKVEVIFASSPLYQFIGKDKIFPSIYKLSNTKQAEDPMDSVVRIMQAQKITNRTTYSILNGATNLGNLNAYGYGGHLSFNPASFVATYLNPVSDINFGAPKEINFEVDQYTSANLFNGYWSEYVAEITDKDSKLLTVNVLLRDIDIYNLNFGRLVYIDGSLWRLNKINNYNTMTNETTQVEFLKVIERIY
jgi:hypothetical protein